MVNWNRTSRGSVDPSGSSPCKKTARSAEKMYIMARSAKKTKQKTARSVKKLNKKRREAPKTIFQFTYLSLLQPFSLLIWVYYKFQFTNIYWFEITTEIWVYWFEFITNFQFTVLGLPQYLSLLIWDYHKISVYCFEFTKVGVCWFELTTNSQFRAWATETPLRMRAGWFAGAKRFWKKMLENA